MGQKAEEQAEQERLAGVQRECIYRGRFISICTDTMKIEGRPPRKWDIVLHPGAVAIVPVNSKGNLLLVQQWRRALGHITIEIPAGTLEDEDPAECAQRELQEETGYKAGKLISFGGIFSAPGFCNEYLHLYLALDLEESKLPADEGEGIDLLEISLEEALRMIEEQTIRDAKSVAGIFRYERWLRKQK